MTTWTQDDRQVRAIGLLKGVYQRLRLEQQERQERGHTPVFPCAAMLDNIEAALREYDAPWVDAVGATLARQAIALAKGEAK